jgi:hypothetical protein
MKIKRIFIYCIAGIFLFGCGSTEQIIPTNTPPPPTNNPPPPNTPQPTNTPIPPLDIEPCAIWDDCQDSTWIGDFVGEDMQTGILYEVDIPYTTSIFVRTGWCTLDDETLQDNLEHMTFIFEIDGVSYLDLAGFEYYAAPDSEDPDISYPCISMGAALSGWKIGEKHKVAIGFRIEDEIFDGWDAYTPQTIQRLFDINPAAIPTDTPTATPNPVAVVNTETAIRSGPGTNYTWLATATVDMELLVIGRKSDCSWLVVILPDGKQGWINADFITYSMPCESFDIASIPPTPTLKPAIPPTATPCAGETVPIVIKNDTGGQVTLYLNGPCSYTFSISPGNTTINILPGNYSYTAYGCGGATLSGSKTLKAGDEWTWFCQ